MKPKVNIDKLCEICENLRLDEYERDLECTIYEIYESTSDYDPSIHCFKLVNNPKYAWRRDFDNELGEFCSHVFSFTEDDYFIHDLRFVPKFFKDIRTSIDTLEKKYNKAVNNFKSILEGNGLEFKTKYLKKEFINKIRPE